MGRVQTRHFIVHRRWPHCGTKTYLGKKTLTALVSMFDRVGLKKNGEDNGKYIHPQIYLGVARRGSLQTAGKGRGIHV